MKRSILILSLLIALVVSEGCNHDRVYYHNRHGKVRRARVQHTPAWFSTQERGYNKHTLHVLRRWDRGMSR